MNSTRRGFVGLLLASPLVGIASLFKSKPEYKDIPAEIAAQKEYKDQQYNKNHYGMFLTNPSYALRIDKGSFQFGNRTVKIMTDERGNDILVLDKENANS